MCYIFYALAVFFGVGYPGYICALQSGLTFFALWDLISLLVTVGASFFLVAAASGTLSFYKDDRFINKKHLIS